MIAAPSPSKTLKIAFTTAPWSFDEIYPASMTGPASITGATPPLGILYLSAVVKQRGHQTAFIDGQDLPMAEVVRKLLEHEPDVVGLSCTSFAWPRSAELCRLLKEARPELITLVGGPHVTGVMTQILDEEAVDYGLSGDAEEGMGLLADALASGQTPGELDIPGLIYRDAEGKPAFQPYRFFRKLDELPLPDYDLVDIRDYPPSIAFYNRLPSMTMMTTRGCPADCSFCDASSNFRVRSIDNVMEEIHYLKERFGLRHILFYDEDLPLAKKRLHDLCRRMIDQELNISWCCNSRADSLDEETLDLMKAAGCWRILVGMETGSQEMLDKVMKGTTLEELKSKTKLIRRKGIEVLGTFILGFPEETYEMGLQTIKFAIECDLDYAIFLKMTPFPGTALSHGIEQHGRLTGVYVPNLISFIPNTMTEEELAKLSVEAIRRFYMRPSYLIKRGLKMRSWRDLERNLRGFFSFLGLKPDEYGDAVAAEQRRQREAGSPPAA